VRNVTISNCVFVGTDRGIRLKARRGRGGVVEDVRVSNLVMDGVLCPFVVNLFYGCGAWGERRITDTSAYPVDEGTPRFRRIRFANITARRVKYAAGYVLGLPEMFVEDVSLDDVSIHLDPANTEAGHPAMASVVAEHCRAGFIARNVKSLSLRNVEVVDAVGAALFVENADRVTVADFESRSIEPAEVCLRFSDVRNGYVRGCAFPAGTVHGAEIVGAATRQFRWGENDTAGLTRPLLVGENVPISEIEDITEEIFEA
jgi:hypothetical protein